ncbi:hypothetical protein NQ318_011452 [Aromia moschata]|uniref:Uncharacterized protein n=1 Tax=Aromia moschata TaxID=1265417 RepID=A0AAV8XCE3_9CUCU|nr:hypothetical protein NQ318_011452 [Aromia moschata]
MIRQTFHENACPKPPPQLSLRTGQFIQIGVQPLRWTGPISVLRRTARASPATVKGFHLGVTLIRMEEEYIQGLPPIEAKTSKKKVNDRGDDIFSTNSVLNSNNTNTDNLTDEDDNGNRASVADLCKKFDDKPLKAIKNGTPNATSKMPEGKPKKHETAESNSSAKLTNGKSKVVNGVKKSSSKRASRQKK